MKGQYSLRGKLVITAMLTVETGLHIGSGSVFAPIGAVDSPFIRDPFTKQPIIPGSSLKGKIRTLLVRKFSKSYVLNTIEEDLDIIKRLFGSAEKNGARSARLQFYDIKLTEESFQQLNLIELDTYIGEVKFENSIDRLTAVANPRQIERVPAGAIFAFRLAYAIEDENDLQEDMDILATGFDLLRADYLGGHGSRGYGKVSLTNFAVKWVSFGKETSVKDMPSIAEKLEGSLSL